MTNEDIRQEYLRLYYETEKLAIIKARENLQSFIAYTDPNYSFQWFHKEICKYLDKLLSGEITKLMIFVPPQHGKSLLSSINFPAYCLGKNPDYKIAIASYGKDLSTGFTKDMQQIMVSKKYQKVFPKTKLKETAGLEGLRTTQNTDFFKIVGKKGFAKAVGIGSGLTGKSVDIAIIDDPFKDRQEALVKANRDTVWSWYQSVLRTRLHNDSIELMLFTRWHEDDIAGRILNPNNPFYNAKEAAKWKILVFPALKENTISIPQSENISDPRQIDGALWEGKHSYERLSIVREQSPLVFNSLYQQRPKAEGGNIIKGEWFKILNKSELPFDIESIVPQFFIDGAYTEKTQNDPSAIMTCYYHKKDGLLYVLDSHDIRKELYELIDHFKRYAKIMNAKNNSIVNVEMKASGESIKSLLKKVEHGSFNVQPIDNKFVQLGKIGRVEIASDYLRSEKVVLVKGSWNAQFIEQCEQFPNGNHDDQIDNLTAAVNKLLHKAVKGLSYD